MGRTRVTLADVAAASGVSVTTASLVLTGRGRELRISEAAERRVRSTARELGYRRGTLVTGPRPGRSQTIGLVLDTVASSGLAGDVLKGALEAAHRRGFVLFVGETRGDPVEERALFEAMCDRRADGIVVAAAHPRVVALPDGPSDVPVVLLNAIAAARSGLPSVMSDERQGGRLAARVLVEAGHLRGVHLIGAGAGGVLSGGAGPGVAVPGGGAPGDALPGDALGSGDASGDALGSGDASGDALRSGDASCDVLSGGVASGGLSLGDVLSSGVVSGSVRPGGVLPGGVASGGLSLGDVLSGDVLPGDVLSGRVASDGVASGGLPPGGVLPGLPTPDDVPPSLLSPGGIAAAERLIGMHEVFEAAGVQLAGAHPCPKWTPEDGYDATRRLLDTHLPRALVCLDDRLAFGAYQALAEAGLSVPGDVSVLGFGGHPVASWMRPRLVTIALPRHELGARAVGMLVDMLDRRARGVLSSSVHRVSMPLREGGSVAPPRA